MPHRPKLEEKFSSRKFMIFLALIGASSVAMFMSFASFDQWAEFAKWAFGIYAASNVAAKYTDNKAFESEMKFERKCEDKE